MPRQFFETYVRQSYEEWLGSPLNERRAHAAVAEANNMAARVWRYWMERRDPSKLHDAENEGRYRDRLAAQECNDFALVRDVADGHKHVQLDRASRRVTRTDQVGSGRPQWNKAKWGEWAWGEQLVVTLDDGTQRPLAAIMRNVMKMWQGLLARWSL